MDKSFGTVVYCMWKVEHELLSHLKLLECPVFNVANLLTSTAPCFLGEYLRTLAQALSWLSMIPTVYQSFGGHRE